MSQFCCCSDNSYWHWYLQERQEWGAWRVKSFLFVCFLYLDYGNEPLTHLKEICEIICFTKKGLRTSGGFKCIPNSNFIKTLPLYHYHNLSRVTRSISLYLQKRKTNFSRKKKKRLSWLGSSFWLKSISISHMLSKCALVWMVMGHKLKPQHVCAQRWKLYKQWMWHIFALEKL